MTIVSKSLVLSAVLAVSLSMPAFAQVSSSANVVTTCSVETATIASCDASVSAYIADLQASGQTTAEVDADLVALATSLAETVQTGADPAVIVSALNLIAAAITDPALAALVAQLAATIAADAEIPVAAIGDPAEASPN